MKIKFCREGLKERAVGVAALVVCVLMIIIPIVSLRAFAEGGALVEIVDENGEIVEMTDGHVILEDPELIAEEELPDTPAIATASEVEKSPAPASEPKETTSPDPTSEPEATASPDPTSEPEATTSPDQTSEPEETTSPDPTSEPEATTSPDPTSEPEVTASPDPTTEPEATASPDPTTEPEATTSPDPTTEPEATASPDPTTEPEVTTSPDATASPDPTDEPEVTPLPTLAPTDEPTTYPTISPDVAAPAYSIQIAKPSGWSGTASEKAKIYVKDEGGTGWSKIEIRLAGGEWINAVGASGGSVELNVDVKRNGLLVVRITDPSGGYHSEQAEITCFDRTAPKVTAGVQNQMLHVEATDAQSGVAGVQVSGLLFTTLENGKLDVSITSLLKEYKKMAVRAYDYAGNFSDVVTIDNPYYQEPAESCPTSAPKPTKKPSGGSSGSSGRATPTPKPKATATPTAKPTATPTPAATSVPTAVPTVMPTATPVVPQYIPLGPGQPYTSGGNMQTLDMLYSASTNKQFITVQTRKGETYYLIIDYDKPIDEEADIYETYFLNLVDDRDLLSVLSEDEIPAPTPTPVVIIATPEPTAVPAPQPETKDDDGKAAALLMLVLIALAGGGAALWYFKLRNDSGKKNTVMLDDELDEDEEDEEL